MIKKLLTKFFNKFKKKQKKTGQLPPILGFLPPSQILEKSNNSISWKQLDRPMADWQMDREIDRRMERHTE